MEKEFWLEKWKNNQIRFHNEEYNKYLTKFWDEITYDKAGVLVPLCGKSKDMLFLAERGHPVVGVELSQSAARSFFEENSLKYSTTEKEGFTIFTGEQITLYVGNFFELDPKWVGDCKYLYDRASLVALPYGMRRDYAHTLSKLSLELGLMITMTFDDDKLGPPFSVSHDEFENLFGGQVKMRELQVKTESENEVLVHQGKITKRKQYVLELRF